MATNDPAPGTEGTASINSSDLSSEPLDHDHSGDFKFLFNLALESLYSETNSDNSSGDTQGSVSHGTSDLGSISTVSFDVVSHIDIYANNATTDSSDAALTEGTSIELIS